MGWTVYIQGDAQAFEADEDPKEVLGERLYTDFVQIGDSYVRESEIVAIAKDDADGGSPDAGSVPGS